MDAEATPAERGRGNGKVVLATVKGDVHDIGKNIVGVVLGCNNYEVIDLGVMVPAAKILDTAAAEKADIVGLSGLITPSLDEMVNVAAEMQRRGMTTPLLIGGATTSRQHTAVRIAPAYDRSTLHVLDASRVAGVVQHLLDPGRAADLDEENRAEQQRLREQHESRRSQPVLTLEAARANAERPDFTHRPEPAFTGVRLVTPPLAELRELIDWQFFFLAWELKGKFPGILDKLPEARELFEEANAMLDEIIAGEQLTARGGYGYWPARRDGDDIVVAAGSAGSGGELRIPMLRQQTVKPQGRPNRCLADYVADEADHVGGFAVAIHGTEELSRHYEADKDDYKSIMVKALADRLAEAFAEYTHLRARRNWYDPDEAPALEDLHAERFRGIRPAFGYPASPDHSLKEELFELLGARDFGMELTESFAMTPAASVSGLLFAHPDSRYFTVGRIARDQVEDYARRRGIGVEEAERWLAPNLAYQ
jgi:5-methyltetrahydrofolate--homocysteine methyltransferase